MHDHLSGIRTRCTRHKAGFALFATLLDFLLGQQPTFQRSLKLTICPFDGPKTLNYNKAVLGAGTRRTRYLADHTLRPFPLAGWALSQRQKVLDLADDLSIADTSVPACLNGNTYVCGRTSQPFERIDTRLYEALHGFSKGIA